MTDAYQCDRCGEYNSGSGKPARVGKYAGSTCFNSEYRFFLKEELCGDCYHELQDVVNDFMELGQ